MNAPSYRIQLGRVVMQNLHSGRATSFSPATANAATSLTLPPPPPLCLQPAVTAAVWSCHGRLLGNQDWGKDFRLRTTKVEGRTDGRRGQKGREGRGEETANTPGCATYCKSDKMNVISDGYRQPRIESAFNRLNSSIQSRRRGLKVMSVLAFLPFNQAHI